MPPDPMLTTEATGEKRIDPGYKTSWIDHLIAAITRFPGPSWLFYLALFIGLVLINNALQWMDGNVAAGTFDPARTIDVIFPIYFLALMHYLNACAGRAMKNFRPVTELTDEEYARFCHELQSVPAWPALIAGLVGLAFVLRVLMAEPASFGILPNSSWITTFFITALSAFWGAVLCVFIVHTVRQLNLVDRIYRSATRIDLFHLKPVYAFSALTARSGIGLIFFIYFMLAISDPGSASTSGELTFNLADDLFISGDVLSLILISALLLTGIAAFILPLRGIHQRLVEEKDERNAEVAARLNITIAKLHGKLDVDNFEQVGGIHSALSALNLEREELNKVSTWPWETGTLRGFVTAILIPIILWLLTRFLEGFL